MKTLAVETAAEKDLHTLAELNRQLIEDEGHDNPMNVEQLRERMREFLRTDYAAYLFREGEAVRGYALVDHRRSPVYLRQFYICRDSRRQGYGRAAFAKLKERLGADRIDIEVLYGNERGYAFWKSLGFAERSVYMRLE